MKKWIKENSEEFFMVVIVIIIAIMWCIYYSKNEQKKQDKECGGCYSYDNCLQCVEDFKNRYK